VLLRHGCGDGAGRDADHSSGFSGPHAFPVGPRRMIDRVLENAGD
jgi:hypothetical protein